MEASEVQWAEGKRGEKPGTVMFWARMLNSGMFCQISPSGENYVHNNIETSIAKWELIDPQTMLMMKTLGANLEIVASALGFLACFSIPSR